MYEMTLNLGDGHVLRFRSWRREHLQRFESLVDEIRAVRERGLELAQDCGSLTAWWLRTGHAQCRPQ